MLVQSPGELDMEGGLAEFAAERDDELLEAYLGEMTREQGLFLPLRTSITQPERFCRHGGGPPCGTRGSASSFRCSTA